MHEWNMINKQSVNKNAGFSMVEFILVITIIAIMVGGSIIGFGMLANGDSKKASKNILSQITELRTNTLSVAGSWTAEIYKINNSYKLDIKKKTALTEELVSSTVIGSKIVISYKDSKITEEPINDSNKLVISFQQGSGKINAVKIVNNDLTEKSQIGPDSKSGKIIVTVNSTSSSNSLTLWYLTGKITTDY